MSVRNKSAYYNDTKRYHTYRVCFLQVEKETEQKIGRGTRGRRFGSVRVLAPIPAKPGIKRFPVQPTAAIHAPNVFQVHCPSHAKTSYLPWLWLEFCRPFWPHSNAALETKPMGSADDDLALPWPAAPTHSGSTDQTTSSIGSTSGYSSPPSNTTTATGSTSSASVTPTTTTHTVISADQSRPSSHLSIGAGVGVAIAAGAVTICVGSLAWFLFVRRHKRPAQTSAQADLVTGKYR